MLCLLPLLFVAVAYLAAVMPGERADLSPGTENLIGLVRGPIHYDFLIPLNPQTRSRYAFAEAAGVPLSLPQAEWLVVGWGARDFYTTAGRFADITATSALKAATGDTSVMHLDVAGDISGIASVTYLTFSNEQFAAFLDAIDASFQRDQTGAPLPIAERFSRHDAFFAGVGHFNLLRTCNVWVGDILRAAGVRLGAWTPLPQTLAFSLDWHNGSAD